MMLFDQLDFRNTNILVIGDLMLDKYWMGETSRISPEAPVPIIKVTGSDTRLGGAANAALNVRSLGANVSVAGIIGNDENGRSLQSLLNEHHIKDLSISSSTSPTIMKLRMISRNQQLVRADFEEKFPVDAIQAITRQCCDLLKQYDVILLSDYNKGTLDHCTELLAAAKKTGTKVIIDPKGNDFSKYRGAYLLTPNMSEFETIVGKCQSEQDMFSKAKQLIADLDLNALLLTRSEKGMTLFYPDGTHHHFNAKAHEVYDVTGAGDTVIATLATAIAKGIALETAVMLSNTAAGIAVGRMGAATVTPLELKLALESANSRPQGITTPEELKTLVDFEKSLGKKVVFTNGCFDILHSGHVQYLQEARALGDRLIVAINDDESVKRLKGPTRPINTVEDRMAVMSSLKCVDWVVSFSSDTPEDLLRLLQPDILVKGGDYGIDGVVGSDIVKAYGGEVKVLSLQQGVSTTNIIDSIKSR
jgi:D-beta-D-heptose 7-phosphate kinase / D-beta-D-heptose 1-phosphate adenosyltransferase